MTLHYQSFALILYVPIYYEHYRLLMCSVNSDVKYLLTIVYALRIAFSRVLCSPGKKIQAAVDFLYSSMTSYTTLLQFDMFNPYPQVMHINFHGAIIRGPLAQKSTLVQTWRKNRLKSTTFNPTWLLMLILVNIIYCSLFSSDTKKAVTPSRHEFYSDNHDVC